MANNTSETKSEMALRREHVALLKQKLGAWIQLNSGAGQKVGGKDLGDLVSWGPALLVLGGLGSVSGLLATLQSVELAAVCALVGVQLMLQKLGKGDAGIASRKNSAGSTSSEVQGKCCMDAAGEAGFISARSSVWSDVAEELRLLASLELYEQVGPSVSQRGSFAAPAVESAPENVVLSGHDASTCVDGSAADGDGDFQADADFAEFVKASASGSDEGGSSDEEGDDKDFDSEADCAEEKDVDGEDDGENGDEDQPKKRTRGFRPRGKRGRRRGRGPKKAAERAAALAQAQAAAYQGQMQGQQQNRGTPMQYAHLQGRQHHMQVQGGYHHQQQHAAMSYPANNWGNGGYAYGF